MKKAFFSALQSRFFNSKDSPSRPANLDDLLKRWDNDGFAVLPHFYRDAEIDAAQAALQHAWDDSGSPVVVDDLATGQRQRICDVDDMSRRTHRFKVNDLYLEYQEVRQLALNARITPILQALLRHAPVLCNSLSFLQGSAQPDHVDSLYMTPRSRGHLIAIWVALEDCHLEAGPLRYYPGSHTIEPYVFSTGSNHVVPEEMSLWSSYMEAEVTKRGLKSSTFPAKRGDVFIWSAFLLHGGSPIVAPERTRKSIVFHYYSEADSRAQGFNLVESGGGYWFKRPHQPVPKELVA